MKLHEEDSDEIVRRLDLLVASHGYSKIFAKVPSWPKEHFIAGRYVEEACLPGFYTGGWNVSFMGKYFTDSRAREEEPQLVNEVLDMARTTAVISAQAPLPPGFAVRTASEDDGDEMAQVYREVFASYPLPIHDPVFLCAAMKNATLSFGV